MKLWKYSGTLLTATGVIHTIYALFLGKEAFTEMLNNGLIAVSYTHLRAHETVRCV